MGMISQWSSLTLGVGGAPLLEVFNRRLDKYLSRME